MIEIKTALYDHFKNDNAKNENGEWYDDDHRTYLEMLGVTADNFHRRLAPVRQPELLKGNIPIIAYYIINMPQDGQISQLKEVILQLDIYDDDPTLVSIEKIAKRHFQMLDGRVLSNSLPYLGKWKHITEMDVPLVNPYFFCYTQRFQSYVKRTDGVTGKKY